MNDLRTLAIRAIESTFPADSDGPNTRDVGRRLLDRAREEYTDWRHESTGVLIRYAELCIEELVRRDRVADRNVYQPVSSDALPNWLKRQAE